MKRKKTPESQKQENTTVDSHYVVKINKELYKRNFELAIRNQTLSLLKQIYNITLSTLASEAMSKKIAYAICASLRLELVGLLFIDEKEQNLIPTAFAISPSAQRTVPKLKSILYSAPIPLTDTKNICVQAFQERKNKHLATLKDIWKGNELENTLSKFLEASHIRSVLVAPLINSEEAMGILIFAFPRPFKDLSRFEHDAIENIIAVVRIALDKARLYHELRIANAKLQETNRYLKELLQMRTEFLQIASHQLRTPLTAIRGLLACQYEGMYDDASKETRKKVQHDMLISAERLNNIVNDLLKATELEGGIGGEFVPRSVEELVEQSIQTLRPNYEKKKLKIDYVGPEKTLPKIKMQQEFLRQAFLNLIDNAERYTPKGKVRVKLYQQNGNIIFEVQDTGIGITTEDRKKLFEKFGRGKEAILVQPNGSGLGLYIVQRIVEGHKGAIDVISKGKGKGSLFRIILPIIR